MSDTNPYIEVIENTVRQAEPDAVERTKNENQDYDLERKKAELESLQNDIDARKKYAYRIFLMIVMWLVVILLIIVLTGRHVLEISDAVLLGLIGSTTVTVASFFLAVTRYLFPSKKDVSE